MNPRNIQKIPDIKKTSPGRVVSKRLYTKKATINANKLPKKSCFKKIY
jgi:hypothetical protein